MNQKELLEDISTKTGQSQKQVKDVLDALADNIAEQVKSDGKITLPGVGIFSQGQRAARTGKNPQTGEALQIAASKVVKFKPLKGIKDSVKNQTA